MSFLAKRKHYGQPPQGFELFGKTLDYKFGNNSKCHLEINYLTGNSVHISFDP